MPAAPASLFRFDKSMVGHIDTGALFLKTLHIMEKEPRDVVGSSTKAAIALFDAGADLRIGLGAEFHS